VVFQPGHDDEATTPPPAPTSAANPTPSASTTIGTPATSAPSAIALKPPQDKGTSVVLSWSFPQELDEYAVIVAEQGAKKAIVGYHGPKTSVTVPVSPGLLYCFQIQGIDGVGMYLSARIGIRGATCVGQR
jgi:hypothetical protein